MTRWRYAWSSFRHFRRAHLGVVFGCACAAAVLVGALVVGDSVRQSLRQQGLARIGGVGRALVARERWFRAALADDLKAASGASEVAPLLSFPGIASVQGASARAGIVSVHGVDERFFALAPTPPTTGRRLAKGAAFVNERTARQLGVVEGDRVLLRVERPSFMPKDMVMASVDELTVAMPVTIGGVLSESEFGRFGLQASQVPPLNVFLDLAWMQAELELPGKANMILASEAAGLQEALASTWTLQDAGLRIKTLSGGSVCELSSERVFLEDAVVEAAREVRPDFVSVFTYFVNTIKHGERETPYSMVAALGRLGAEAAPVAAALEPLLALGLRDDAAVGSATLNSWLARDLGVEVDGDGRVVGAPTITMSYFVMGGDLRLREESSTLPVGGVVPLKGAAADRTLLPEFPGLHDVDNCRDWEPGVPVDLDRIRDVDETYWDEHRGTPKAFLDMGMAQRLFGNRFGKLTALRTAGSAAEELGARLPRVLDPARLGLFFRDVRGPALAAANPATDFGGLFLGLSFFLIIAALLLTSLLFVFGVEQRANEIGVLLAVGFTPKRVRRGFLLEAALLASVGAAIGGLAGLAYTRAVLHFLGTLWRDAVGLTALEFHASGTTVMAGVVAAVAVSLCAIWFALRKAFEAPAIALLNSRGGLPPSGAEQRAGRASLVLGLSAPLAAVGIAVGVGPGAEQAAGAFFGAGALLLVGGAAWARRLFVRQATRTGGLASRSALGVRNAGRRVGRSMATVLLLASGAFLVLAVQAYRLEPPRDPSDRTSGTGGFALFGRSTLPVPRDLGGEAGRDAFGIGDEDLADVAIVPMRVREGDDASCLNLSRPQNPRLVSVRPRDLAERGAFAFASSPDDVEGSPWALLDGQDEDGAVPAIGDQASVQWSLHKAIGDTLAYRDENGEVFEVRIVATVANSILQGNLVISEPHFRERFPSASGYRMFLVDAPAERVDEVTGVLTEALEDVGLELTPTGERLREFNAVQNTYLLIFQALGGLGLLLGSAGLGAVVLRNALERRSELAVLGATGFSQSAIRGLLWAEHGFLLLVGLGIGAICAAVATLPGLLGSGAGVAVGPMALLIVAVLVSGAAWVRGAAALAVRGPVLSALNDD